MDALSPLRVRLEAALNTRITRVAPLGSGATGSVVRLELDSAATAVAKLSHSAENEGLAIEGRMLRLLAERSKLPVPRVMHAERAVLVMEFKEGSSSFDARAERHAAELLAELHAVRSPDGRYGLEFDGLIGPLHQPNARSASWVEFWREHRVLHMSACAAREGRIDTRLTARLERLTSRLEEIIPDRPPASLIHGDVWSGNVLARAGSITAFLDPAPYYAHHEVELAFITLFSTFGREFFDRYAAVHAPIDPEFWSMRKHLYNVYPLLVHVRLFGGSYVAQLASCLDMLGF